MATRPDEMTDKEYLAAVRAAREESVRFFSPENRAERELWVAKEFLTNLGVDYLDTELVHVTDDPPDVRFRGAAFEVKEILDPGRRRHAEYKEALEKAKAARKPRDLLEPVRPRDITYAQVCTQIEARLADLEVKYSTGARAQLDLLFYVNLENAFGYVPTPLPPPARWERFGYRSLCILMGRLSGVLIASENAPEFLKNGGARIVLRPRPHETAAI
jgi:hypothetical protein